MALIIQNGTTMIQNVHIPQAWKLRQDEVFVDQTLHYLHLPNPVSGRVSKTRKGRDEHSETIISTKFKKNIAKAYRSVSKMRTKEKENTISLLSWLKF